MSSTLTDKVVHSVSWLAIGRLLGSVLRGTVTITLVRLILPQDFGVFAIAQAANGFGTLVINSGFGEALIHKAEASEDDIQSVFWLTTSLTLIVVILTGLLSGLIADHYKIPELKWLLRAFGLYTFIGSLGNTPHILLLKSLRIADVTKIHIVGHIIYSIITIVCALRGLGVWSLIIGAMIQVIIETVIMFIVSQWTPRLLLSLKSLRELSGFTINFFSFQVVSYWSRNIDTLLLGQTLGPLALGLYNRAYGVMVMPVGGVGNLLTTVMFPALVSLNAEPIRMKHGYLRATNLVVFLIAPAMLGIMAVARPLIEIVFGSNWLGMITVLRLLAPVAITQSIVGTTYWLFMSQGKTGRLLRWELINLTGVIIAVGTGIFIGSIEAVALCYLVVNIISMYPSIILAGRLINLSFLELIRIIAPVIVNAGLMSIAVWLLLQYGLVGLAQWQKLGLGVGFGIVVYTFLMLIQKDSVIYDALALFRDRFLSQIKYKAANR